MNWREYEAGLRNRGSLTVWISLTAGKLVNWDAPRPRRRKPGRQRKYSNHAIETAVTLGMVFHLSSRQSEGLLRSLFALMKLDNDVPDHTTISRRKAKLGKVPFYQDKQKTPLHILIDSSGLAAHAGQLRRAPNSRDYHRSPRVLIPPRKGAQLASWPASSRQRNRNIAAQARLGKRKWHTESGYREQSRDNVPSLQGYRGLSDASERVGGTESRGKDRVQDSEHHDGARDA